MATNDFLTFAQGGSANVMSQTDYAALTAIIQNGFTTGTALSARLNKVWRQSSAIASMIGAFIASCGFDARDDGNPTTLLTNFEAALKSINPFKPGFVIFSAFAAPPSGFLLADGSAVSRTTYADLFAAIGTLYGIGDGSTTFNLPELRGEFIRCLDGGRGVDAGRTIGSYQQGTHVTADNNQALAVHGWADSTTIHGDPATDLGIPLVYTNITGQTYCGSDYARVARPRNVALSGFIKY